MRARPFRLTGIVFAVAALVSPSGHADPITVAPPFTNADSYDYCDAYYLSSCTSFSEADAETGTMTGEAEIVSPQGGVAPWLGYAYAAGNLGRTGRLKNPVPAIELTVTMHVAEASATMETLLAEAGSPLRGRASVYADVYVNLSGCFCGGQASVLLASTSDDLATQDEDVTMTLTLQNYEGGSLQPGELSLNIWVYGDASLNWSVIPPLVDAGSVGFEYDLAVTSVTARIVDA